MLGEGRERSRSRTPIRSRADSHRVPEAIIILTRECDEFVPCDCGRTLVPSDEETWCEKCDPANTWEGDNGAYTGPYRPEEHSPSHSSTDTISTLCETDDEDILP